MFLDAHDDQEQELIESTNAVVEDFNNVAQNFKLIKLVKFACKIPTQLKKHFALHYFTSNIQPYAQFFFLKFFHNIRHVFVSV